MVPALAAAVLAGAAAAAVHVIGPAAVYESYRAVKSGLDWIGTAESRASESRASDETAAARLREQQQRKQDALDEEQRRAAYTSAAEHAFLDHMGSTAADATDNYFGNIFAASPQSYVQPLTPVDASGNSYSPPSRAEVVLARYQASWDAKGLRPIA